ncbi:MAG: hypothetical protein ACLFR1_15085 [Spirochaetia bacterium]
MNNSEAYSILEVFFGILGSWEVLIILICALIAYPAILYIASVDKKPVKLRAKQKGKLDQKREQKMKAEENQSEEEDNEEEE